MRRPAASLLALVLACVPFAAQSQIATQDHRVRIVTVVSGLATGIDGVRRLYAHATVPA